MALSEAVVSGKEAPRTLKVSGLIQDVEVLILIDYGSSHSSISEQVDFSLVGVTSSSQPTWVKVANGQVVKSCYEILQAKWSVQGYVSQSDIKVLQLQCFDMVIGMEWLDRYILTHEGALGSVMVNYSLSWNTIDFARPYSLNARL
jgi:hypothetical protein